MTATIRAKAYLEQLAPHVRQREAARVIRELIAEVDALRIERLRRRIGIDEDEESLIRAIVAISRAIADSPGEVRIAELPAAVRQLREERDRCLAALHGDCDDATRKQARE